jgi:hypothetical protein
MKAEKSKPDQAVRDGVQNDAGPIPKEPAGSPATTGPAQDSEAAGPIEPGGAGANDPSGPAEEQDNTFPEERGLTTELEPSD